MKKHATRTGPSESQKGFTIIELLIALAILSTLLVMSTVILLQIGRLYTKGVNQSEAQNATRNLVNAIASQLQLAGATPDLSHAGSGVYCLGNQRYTFVLYKQLVDPSTPSLSGNEAYHVLWRDTTSGSGTCTPIGGFTGAGTPNDSQSVPGSGAELIPQDMRLTEFKITVNSNSTYSIDAAIVFGDDDLLCDSGTAGDCNSTTTSTHLTNPTGEIKCKGITGSEYCAVSSLHIIVGERILVQ